jgi:hypothetical protein
VDGPVRTYTASVVLPYRHLAGATAGLRAELGHQIAHQQPGELPNWDTLHVEGPAECTDARGRAWFEYRATVEGRPSRTGWPERQQTRCCFA